MSGENCSCLREKQPNSGENCTCTWRNNLVLGRIIFFFVGNCWFAGIIVHVRERIVRLWGEWLVFAEN